LSAYVDRMQEKQKHIYFVNADSYMAAKNSPLLEVFRKKEIEVLLLSDRVDEWLVSHLAEFKGKKLQSVSQGALDLGDLEDEDNKEQQQQEEEDFKDTIDAIKKALVDTVEDVRVTHRLTDSPACVVYGEQGMTGHMQRLLQAAGQAFPESKPILELNPNHPLMLKVKGVSDDQQIQRWSQVLLNQALLAEGEQLKDPSSFVKELNQLLLDQTS
jgi:molecular chaperone HtpG